jgi:FAD:protein FMN transferase
MKNIYLLFALLLFAFCSHKTQNTKPFAYTKIAGYAQGTTYHITYENSVNQNLQMQVDSILKAFDLSLSEYIPNSIISRINANDLTVKTDYLFNTIFQKSRIVYNNTGGAFDITVGPLVDAWGFGPKGRKFPRKGQIDTLLHYVGMEKVKIENNKVIKKYPQVSIDVNAIAQGFSVDVVCHYFDSKGINNYIVEIGGELRAKGKNAKGKNWRVGIDRPVDGNNNPGAEIQKVINISDKAMATSGNYRKFYEENGVKYAHHINPHTGYPAKQTILSVTLISNECAMCDGYATGCMVVGLDKTKEFLKKHTEFEAYIVYSDNKGQFCEYMTEGVKKLISK